MSRLARSPLSLVAGAALLVLAAGPAPGARGVLTPEEIWHMVNYVLSLSRE